MQKLYDWICVKHDIGLYCTKSKDLQNKYGYCHDFYHANLSLGLLFILQDGYLVWWCHRDYVMETYCHKGDNKNLLKQNNSHIVGQKL